MSFIKDLLGFLFAKRTRIVLIPFVTLIVIFVCLLAVSEGAAWAPFVYPLF